jgi:hypothetical protein
VEGRRGRAAIDHEDRRLRHDRGRA